MPSGIGMLGSAPMTIRRMAGTYGMLPLSQVLGLDLKSSGFFSVLPWITMALSANVGGWIADTMVEKGVSVTAVRKIMQTVSCWRK